MADITISYKDATIAEVSSSGTTTLETAGKYCEDDISLAYVKPSGGVSAPLSDVNFIDYDGTIVYSYSASDFANLSALPDNPSHQGLTAQGWNWTLADAKAQVSVSGQLDIGQMYVTDDGKTRIYIELESGRLSPTLAIFPNGTVTVDWGDGSSDTITGTSLSTVKTKQHTYAKAGAYKIELTVTGTCRIGASSTYQCLIGAYDSSVDIRNNVYRSSVKRIELGNNLQFNRNCFYAFLNMESITIPSYVTAFDNSSFYTCRSLRHITFPSGITTMGTSMFRDNTSLKSISIPKEFPTNSEMFRFNYALRRFSVPNVATLAQRFLQDCYSLSSITIPSTVTSIASEAFSGCQGLAEVHFKGSTPPTLANANVFYNLPTDCKIYVPSGYLSAYTSASNYPSSSTYTYNEE